MTKLFLFIWVCCIGIAPTAAQKIPAYYKSINFSESGKTLKNSLSKLITRTHTTPTTYKELWQILQQTDKVPGDPSQVYLVYGYNTTHTGDPTADLTRLGTNYGGNAGEWNREHIFAKANWKPPIDETDTAGSDGQHVRAADVLRNNARGNLKFIDAQGSSGPIKQSWYPGDQWRGDVARIIMYCYVRYGSRAAPTSNAIGTTNITDKNMVDVLLKWNAMDPVSAEEQQRNDYLQPVQGNRNPFIDNPYLATKIWGGPVAKDTWGLTAAKEPQLVITKLKISPNVTQTYISYTGGAPQYDRIYVVDKNGNILLTDGNLADQRVALPNSPGVYFIKFVHKGKTEVHQVIKETN